ncbi:MAG: imidazole glycerol phosphate synthase subunit HisH [Armatimonadetes bacterium]|nr:imidazole glycerol phosphate synthase subunit HisH [Armatimonadota bacterium]
MSKTITIINTGVANIASVQSAFSRLGYECAFAQTADEVFENPAVILPGVGAFGAGMSALESLEFVRPLRLRIGSGKATLAVCLGMQLLCESSEETPGVAGLGILKASVRKFPEGVRTPHFGWNHVESSSPYFGPGYAYFANSYRLDKAPAGWEVATCDHGGEFVAAIRRGSVVAAQFHPEISSSYGRELLKKWLEGVRW